MILLHTLSRLFSSLLPHDDEHFFVHFLSIPRDSHVRRKIFVIKKWGKAYIKLHRAIKWYVTQCAIENLYTQI